MNALNRIQFAKLSITASAAEDNEDLLEVLNGCHRAVLALQELVELKAIKDKLDADRIAGDEARIDAAVYYAMRQEKAWEDARAALLRNWSKSS